MNEYLTALEAMVSNPLKEIYKKLKPIKYGSYNDKTKSFTNRINDKNYKDIRILTPQETLKYKIGTCYEQSILTAYLAKQYGCDYSCIYYLNIGGNTHLTCNVQYQSKWYWIEHAWGNRRNIYGPFNTLEDINTLTCKYWFKQYKLPILFIKPNFNVSKFFNGKHMNTEITDMYPEKCIDIMGYKNDNQIKDIQTDKNHKITSVTLKNGKVIKP